MRCCWSHSNTSGNMIAPGVILLGVLCISGIIRSASANPPGSAAGLLTVFLVLYALPLFCAFVSARKYMVSSEGLTIVYPFGIKKHYAWSAFSEIALCKIHYASGSADHILGIRCAIGTETCVPKDAAAAREQWSTMAYELKHFRNLVSIYYTPERYTEFTDNCPYPIKDYRALKDKA